MKNNIFSCLSLFIVCLLIVSNSLTNLSSGITRCSASQHILNLFEITSVSRHNRSCEQFLPQIWDLVNAGVFFRQHTLEFNPFSVGFYSNGHKLRKSCFVELVESPYF